MLNDQGFDLWAESYEGNVDAADGREKYPFAGYKRVLNFIYSEIMGSFQKTVLDIGFGTGTLTSRLYEKGCAVFGQDFSREMIERAQARMPLAKLYCGDFAQGLAEELTKNRYDAIVATYSLHHLTDGRKVELIGALLPLLNDNGRIYIGDVAFETREDLRKCRELTGGEWDDDEIYFVYDELKRSFPEMKFKRFSYCAGVLSLEKPI